MADIKIRPCKNCRSTYIREVKGSGIAYMMCMDCESRAGSVQINSAHYQHDAHYELWNMKNKDD